MKLTDRVSVHYFSHNLDSMFVVETDTEVLVNINDALHSSNPKAISYFTGILSARWPSIDYVFCGFGGASHFPNCFHVEGKDDVETAHAREWLFAQNFAQIVSELDPKVAVPFAADFVLLNPETRWINDTRIKRSMLPKLYAEKFPDSTVRITPMYPADVIEGGDLVDRSPYRNQMVNDGLDHLIEKEYASMIKKLEVFSPIDEGDATEFF